MAVGLLSWGDLLRICGAYEAYCRVHSMDVHKDKALQMLTSDPEIPRSLRFATGRIEELLAGIDPAGRREGAMGSHSISAQFFNTPWAAPRPIHP